MGGRKGPPGRRAPCAGSVRYRTGAAVGGGTQNEEVRGAGRPETQNEARGDAEGGAGGAETEAARRAGPRDAEIRGGVEERSTERRGARRGEETRAGDFETQEESARGQTHMGRPKRCFHAPSTRSRGHLVHALARRSAYP